MQWRMTSGLQLLLVAPHDERHSQQSTLHRASSSKPTYRDPMVRHTCAGLHLLSGGSGHWAISVLLALELAAQGQLSAGTAGAAWRTSALPEPAGLAEPCQVGLPAMGRRGRHPHTNADRIMQRRPVPLSKAKRRKGSCSSAKGAQAAKQSSCTPWMTSTAGMQDAQHGGNCLQQHLPVVLGSAFQVAHDAAFGLRQLSVFSSGAFAAYTQRPAAGAH